MQDVPASRLCADLRTSGERLAARAFADGELAVLLEMDRLVGVVPPAGPPRGRRWTAASMSTKICHEASLNNV
jgi:hypothetical protein